MQSEVLIEPGRDLSQQVEIAKGASAGRLPRSPATGWRTGPTTCHDEWRRRGWLSPYASRALPGPGGDTSTCNT